MLYLSNIYFYVDNKMKININIDVVSVERPWKRGEFRGWYKVLWHKVLYEL